MFWCPARVRVAFVRWRPVWWLERLLFAWRVAAAGGCKRLLLEFERVSVAREEARESGEALVARVVVAGCRSSGCCLGFCWSFALAVRVQGAERCLCGRLLLARWCE